METTINPNNGIVYHKFTDDERTTCPVCQALATSWCRCANTHFYCENNHCWHIGIKVERKAKFYPQDRRMHVISYTDFFVLDKFPHR